MSEPAGRTGILLARHGETDDNRPPIRVQGFRDTPLNDRGRRQAAELAERVADRGLRSLWSSDLRRASEPAQIVGDRIWPEPPLDPLIRDPCTCDYYGLEHIVHPPDLHV